MPRVKAAVAAVPAVATPVPPPAGADPAAPVTKRRGQGSGKHRARLVNDYPPDQLIGRKLTAIRPMTEAEMRRERWPLYPNTVPVCLVFEDGTVIFPGRDSYGESGPGYLLGTVGDRDNRQFVFRSVPAH